MQYTCLRIHAVLEASRTPPLRVYPVGLWEVTLLDEVLLLHPHVQQLPAPLWAHRL